jgi:hypothetical protein
MRQLASAKRGRWIEVVDELNRAHGWPAGFVRAAGCELSERTLERLLFRL